MSCLLPNVSPALSPALSTYLSETLGGQLQGWGCKCAEVVMSGSRSLCYLWGRGSCFRLSIFLSSSVLLLQPSPDSALLHFLSICPFIRMKILSSPITLPWDKEVKPGKAASELSQGQLSWTSCSPNSQEVSTFVLHAKL